MEGASGLAGLLLLRFVNAPPPPQLHACVYLSSSWPWPTQVLHSDGHQVFERLGAAILESRMRYMAPGLAAYLQLADTDMRQRRVRGIAGASYLFAMSRASLYPAPCHPPLLQSKDILNNEAWFGTFAGWNRWTATRDMMLSQHSSTKVSAVDILALRGAVLAGATRHLRSGETIAIVDGRLCIAQNGRGYPFPPLTDRAFATVDVAGSHAHSTTSTAQGMGSTCPRPLCGQPRLPQSKFCSVACGMLTAQADLYDALTRVDTDRAQPAGAASAAARQQPVTPASAPAPTAAAGTPPALAAVVAAASAGAPLEPLPSAAARAGLTLGPQLSPPNRLLRLASTCLEQLQQYVEVCHVTPGTLPGTDGSKRTDADAPGLTSNPPAPSPKVPCPLCRAVVPLVKLAAHCGQCMVGDTGAALLTARLFALTGPLCVCVCVSVYVCLCMCVCVRVLILFRPTRRRGTKRTQR